MRLARHKHLTSRNELCLFSGITGKSSEQIDAFRPSEGTLARVSHLIQLAKADALSPEERTELDPAVIAGRITSNCAAIESSQLPLSEPQPSACFG
jgi:hypothetical protein